MKSNEAVNRARNRVMPLEAGKTASVRQVQDRDWGQIITRNRLRGTLGLVGFGARRRRGRARVSSGPVPSCSIAFRRTRRVSPLCIALRAPVDMKSKAAAARADPGGAPGSASAWAARQTCIGCSQLGVPCVRPKNSSQCSQCTLRGVACVLPRPEGKWVSRSPPQRPTWPC